MKDRIIYQLTTEDIQKMVTPSIGRESQIIAVFETALIKALDPSFQRQDGNT